jgi:adenosylcobinamide-GDP ribazoletransferase
VSALRKAWHDLLAAIQFLTRIPVPALAYEQDTLARSVQYFPMVGLLVGAVAALLNFMVAPHLPRLVTALVVVIFLVGITGCFHEDALADTFDGFGGGWNREQILTILKDSRIGSYGAAALTLSLIARVTLLASLPVTEVARTLIAAHVLCRWTTLPLSYFLAPARAEAGQGARLAKLTSRRSLLVGTLMTLAIVIAALGLHAIVPIVLAVMITYASGAYYNSRIQGVTGDCFGATNQLTEILVYLAGVWTMGAAHG